MYLKPLALPRARLRRRIWALEERVRAAFRGSHLGFESRPEATEMVGLVEARRPVETRLVKPTARVMGVASPSPERSSALAAAGFYGIDARVASPAGARALLSLAAAEDWPLVALTLAAGETYADAAEPLRTYIYAGGCALIEVVEPSLGGLPAGLAEALGIRVSIRRAPRDRAGVTFSGLRPDLTHEFAGVRVEGVRAPLALGPPPAAEVIATLSDPANAPAVCELRPGRGRVVITCGPPLEQRIGEAYAPAGALVTLPAMMLVRSLYGEAAWQPSLRLANFTVDDPALRSDKFGLPYTEVLTAARNHGFHVTAATIPAELDIADPATVALLDRNRAQLSACYHGNDHRGYEFVLPTANRLHYRRRTLLQQRHALAQARARGTEFWRRYGYALDRVMVFPHGIGPAAILAPLQALGFLASCNFCDRYPLGAVVPPDADLGMRPADVYEPWAGFPLLWRRGLPDRSWIFDLFVGRPVMTFAHPRSPDLLRRFSERADEVNELGRGSVAWQGLEEIAQHAYLQRRRPRSPAEWEVLMLGNSACLHNPSTEAVTFYVRRPHMPPGAWLLGPDTVAPPGSGLAVTVSAQSTARVTLWADGWLPLPADRRCSLFPNGPRD